MPQAIDLSFARPNTSAFLPSSKPIAPPFVLCHCERSEAMTLDGIFQPLTKNLHGFESQGSGVLFKPTRGPFVTSEFGTLNPVSIHKPPPIPVKSTPFSLLVIPIARQSLPGPKVSRPF